MKKSILVVAVGAALAMVGAAQAEVAISGEAHLSFDQLNNGKDSWLALSNNTSTLAIKATEEIEGGMKATVFYEQSVTADTGKQNTTVTTKATNSATLSPNGAPVAWDKQSYINLSGGFGGVTIGRVESPVKKLSRKVDFFGNQVGDSRNMIGASSKADLRASNSLTYTTMDMGGFTADVMYIAEDGNKTKTGGYQLAGNYNAGPIYVGLGYQSLDKGNSADVTVPGTIPTTADTETTLRLVGSYTMGDMKFGGLIQSGKALDGKTYISGTNKNDRTAFGLGGSFKIGAGTAKAQVYKLGETKAKKDGAMEIALGYDHNLSKNTMVYVAYAMTNNDAGASFSASGAGHGDSTLSAAGKDPSALSFGTKVKF